MAANPPPALSVRCRPLPLCRWPTSGITGGPPKSLERFSTKPYSTRVFKGGIQPQGDEIRMEKIHVFHACKLNPPYFWHPLLVLLGKSTYLYHENFHWKDWDLCCQPKLNAESEKYTGNNRAEQSFAGKFWAIAEQRFDWSSKYLDFTMFHLWGSMIWNVKNDRWAKKSLM